MALTLGDDRPLRASQSGCRELSADDHVAAGRDRYRYPLPTRVATRSAAITPARAAIPIRFGPELVVDFEYVEDQRCGRERHDGGDDRSVWVQPHRDREGDRNDRPQGDHPWRFDIDPGQPFGGLAAAVSRGSPGFGMCPIGGLVVMGLLLLTRHRDDRMLGAGLGVPFQQGTDDQ